MRNLECIALFVEDLAACKKFYPDILDLEIVYEDLVSSGFKLENVMINLRTISEAPGLIVPGKVADRSAACANIASQSGISVGLFTLQLWCSVCAGACATARKMHVPSGHAY